MEKTIFDILTNSVGAVMVAGLFLYFDDKKEKRVANLIETQLKQSTEALEKTATSLARLSTIVDKFSQATKGCPARRLMKK